MTIVTIIIELLVFLVLLFRWFATFVIIYWLIYVLVFQNSNFLRYVCISLPRKLNKNGLKKWINKAWAQINQSLFDLIVLKLSYNYKILWYLEIKAALFSLFCSDNKRLLLWNRSCALFWTFSNTYFELYCEFFLMFSAVKKVWPSALGVWPSRWLRRRCRDYPGRLFQTAARTWTLHSPLAKTHTEKKMRSLHTAAAHSEQTSGNPVSGK